MSPFLSYLLRRLGLAAGVLWAAYTVSFAVLYLLPGDPVQTMAGGGLEGEPLSPAELDALRARYGLDASLAEQYLNRLVAALQGDFGASIQNGRQVWTLITDALPTTLALAAAGIALAVVGGTTLALVATYTSAAWLRQILLALPSLSVSLPVFWVGLMLVQVFSFRFGWFPAVGARDASALVLPAITLAIPTGAQIAQVLAASLAAAVDEPYATTARAKGVGRIRLIVAHALRNAALPALTVAGVIVGQVLSGIVVIETVFTRPGLGRLTVTAVSYQDIPVVQGVVLFAATVFVLVNLAVDLLYPLLDPRLVTGPARGSRPAAAEVPA